MNLRSDYIKRIFTLTLLGIDEKKAADALAEIYLISKKEKTEILEVVTSEKLKNIHTSSDLKVFDRWKNYYGNDLYDLSEKEKEFLKLKKLAMHEVESLRLGEKDEFIAEKLLKNKEDPRAAALCGTLFYFGLGAEKNKRLGENLLLYAARCANDEALLWKLRFFPDERKEALCSLNRSASYIAERASIKKLSSRYKLRAPDQEEDGFTLTHIGF